ncbi:flotillin family protein [Fulvivirgaceae bacterium BMA10]|uniref:Flotillin family protein n=1 Tax=Splendidivirga corallicola TaxID=3051826 RepID=A0ABT8KI65_9BACT|nr:flotillin family protein [Fulvivirgaceae bacterium BMA10]
MAGSVIYALIIIGSIFLFGALVAFIKMYKKVIQGEAIVKTGKGGTKVSFEGMFVIPVLHKMEVMDITLKTMVISRTGKDGLICQDNLRADIKVTFFVRVNKTKEDVIHVAQSIGCQRASSKEQLELLFDAKFSEALKTVGKQFDFVELYNSRAQFRERIIEEIGTNLNGYILDDCAIDYLEQTPLDSLNESNILDAEGIKKIIDITSREKIKANLIEKEKEKTITKQNVEARETILELEKQLAETEEKQRKEVESIKAREEAEIKIVQEQERLKSEKSRIQTDEEVQVAEQNKAREVLVAQKNKEKTDAVETERVEQARMLEATERERIVTLAQIEKEKAVEEERKNIQDVIRERVAVEKAVVEEEEKIKDTKAYSEAERNKKVAITNAERDAEQALVKEIKDAEAKKQAAEHRAKQILIDAEAEQASAGHKADAVKTLAEAKAAEAAALGMSEAQVMEAKAAAKIKQGEAEASLIEDKAEAEAKGIEVRSEAQAIGDQKLGLAQAKVVEAKAEAEEKKGLAEARVIAEKLAVDAKGIEQKADAMKKLDGVGKEHEEFKLNLEKDKEIELASINIQRDIAMAQAEVISEALKAANIDIVGGETMFFNQIMGAITKGKTVDRMVDNSHVIQDVKDVFFTTDTGQSFKDKLRQFVGQFGLNTNDIKNLSVSALLLKLIDQAKDSDSKDVLNQLSNVAKALGIDDKAVNSLGII